MKSRELKLALKYNKSVENKERTLEKYQYYVKRIKLWISQDKKFRQQALNKLDLLDFNKFGQLTGYTPEGFNKLNGDKK